MLERKLTLEGGTLYCDLGSLEPGGWQTLDCSLRLAGVLPERRVAVSVEVLEGDVIRGSRIFAVSPWITFHACSNPRSSTSPSGRVISPQGRIFPSQVIQ